MRFISLIAAGLLGAGCLAEAGSAAPSSPAETTIDIPFEGQGDAPDFPESLAWLNTARPISLRDVRGKVVLLDFWTYCCINCMHVIPDLKKLETKYARELVVIGVHSAKFKNEKMTENIREAIQRYEIEHPVVNDQDFQIWRSYSVRAWPTLMLLNPQGRVIGAHSGEGIFELFDQIIGETVRHFDAKGLIDRRPISFALEKEKTPRSVLAYPGKIAADENSKRLFFTDSNHNRVIVASFGGEILECIGDGQSGLTDGSFSTARFFRPQGLCFDPKNELIYVADTENHAVRQIDLKSRSVKTLAGNGRQARRFGQEGKGVELNSPWDLVLNGGKLYIAMAGPHQLWTLDPNTHQAAVHAGTGRENITDGPLKECALAQPSGITTDGQKLYFADSEVSAVRVADLAPSGRVDTLIGEGLFEFGDIDGSYPKARLQHCLGVAFHDGFVYVADTYNHKIKKLNPKTKEVTTFIGTGQRGAADGPAGTATLNEPSGLCFADGQLYIADANNHLIRVCDLKTGQVSTMDWKNVSRLVRRDAPLALNPEIELPARKISSAARVLDFKILLPVGTKLNPGAESTLKIKSNGPALRVEKADFRFEKDTVEIPISAQPGNARLTMQLSLLYCDAKNAGLCYFKEATLAVPVEIVAGEASKLAVEYAVHAP